jgi:hypothetical protein
MTDEWKHEWIPYLIKLTQIKKIQDTINNGVIEKNAISSRISNYCVGLEYGCSIKKINDEAMALNKKIEEIILSTNESEELKQKMRTIFNGILATFDKQKLEELIEYKKSIFIAGQEYREFDEEDYGYGGEGFTTKKLIEITPEDVEEMY